MALIIDHNKALSSSPLKVSAPLGAALAFMGMRGCLPMFHGSQGCTAFALVMMVRHFREAIPLQTTAMNEISTILGGMDQVEQGLLNIARRARPEMIGLISTALTETRGEDMGGDVRAIRARNRELADIAVIDVSAPDFAGSLETGWGKAVTAIIRQLVRPAGGKAALNRVNLLPGCHLTPGDVEALKDIVAGFGLEAVVLPDLSDSLDGHVPESYMPTTLGGTGTADVGEMGRSRLTIAVGEHMRIAAKTLEDRTGVPFVVLDRVTGLEAVDRLMVCLSSVAGVPVPARQRRARSQLVDAMLDGHFYFAGRRIAIAGEPSLVWTMGRLVADLGATIAAAVTTRTQPLLADLPAERVIVGDFEDMEDQILEAGGCDLIIANSNARQVSTRHGIPLFRAGFPVFDRLGAAHMVGAGYGGTRDLITGLGNILMESPGHAPDTEHVHDHAAAAAG
ncbi:nitrogenase iron-molybdenum cofactor biosynthesis protein NifN [Magnetospirillum sp. SS-4]|uniref:nitrogenase iron-molybdenum cofactor biosynthesis protein NifN n=1 Tax=Magnetospirillum sp. SS-4 TaxID=2681465 RepID=UPI001384E6DE|nr:nitrogenase iron-molybdenum cofactor biosynthesis protein NifN [Magnetospirillum sp. SS-4]CAA7623084.1 Nitrogenase iron-molybdenum cofactor biosynthesis protein NifN [Magnetospirillum sp. SS-4]